MRELLTQLDRRPRNPLERDRAGHEARDPARDNTRPGYRVLLLGDPHPGDKPSQRAGDLIDNRGRMAGPGQRKACRVREVANGHERGFGIANDVQATIY